MQIQNGIKIFRGSDDNSNIFLSNGIRIANTLNGLECKRDTFVPNEPWRLPNKAEREILFHDIAADAPFQSIGIVKLPNEIIELLKRVGIQNAETPRDFGRITNSTSFQDTYKAILDYARLFQKEGSQFFVDSIGCFPKGLETITKNFAENHYIGLHRDAWDCYPVERLDEASNRICFNIGRNNRSFLFINQQIKYLSRVIDKEASSINNSSDLVKLFLSQNMSYPVIKMVLRPFEGYIAPTENIIHDGSTLGQEYIDINISIRSYFLVSKLVFF